MKIHTHHIAVIVAAILSIPLFSAVWIAWRYFGAIDTWRPWLLFTTYSELGDNQWNFALQIGAVAALALLALLLYLFEGSIWSVASSDLHGDAHWATRKEVNAANLNQGWGVVLGREGRGPQARVLRTHEADYSNILLSGPPRSGKGAGVIIPTLLDYPGSFIVYDVKGENYQHTARLRKENGDRVRVFCPFDATLEDGHEIKGRSHGFNPLIPIAANPDIEDRLTEIAVMADALFSVPSSREQGLLDSGVKIFRAVCAIACAEKTPSIGRVVDLLSPKAPEEGEVADLQIHLAELAQRAPDPLSRDALLSASANSNKNLGVYMAVLFDAGLEAWLNPAIRRATETHDFDFDKLRSFPYSIYIVIPTPYKRTATPVVRLFMQFALRTLQLRLPDLEREPLPVLFMIDEFHSLGKMQEVLDAPTVIPGFNGRIVCAVQSPASLDEIYGREAARIFLDVTQLKIFLTPNDNVTKDMIEKTLGYTTKVSKSVSGRGISEGGHKSHSFSEIKRPLMSADEIGQMPKDKQIITVQGRSPLFVDRIQYWKDVQFQKRYESQSGLPWPTDEIPVIKDGVVTHIRDFLKPPKAASSDNNQPDAETVEPDSLVSYVCEPEENGVSGIETDETTSIFAVRSDEEAAADISSMMKAAWTSSQSDMSVIADLDRHVSEQEDSPVSRCLRAISPATLATRVMDMADGSFSGGIANIR